MSGAEDALHQGPGWGCHQDPPSLLGQPPAPRSNPLGVRCSSSKLGTGTPRVPEPGAGGRPRCAFLLAGENPHVGPRGEPVDVRGCHGPRAPPALPALCSCSFRGFQPVPLTARGAGSRHPCEGLASRGRRSLCVQARLFSSFSSCFQT